ncbi:unnamed protein product [Peniophora sp. CBMAI 1063]|nr:unnamed protein product [Peniophora sp. CBMAI 1063]
MSSSSSSAAYPDTLPPREPSPVPINPLSPAPSLRTQRSRQRLRLPLPRAESPPIPPTLIGSPLLQNTKSRARTVSLNPVSSAKQVVERRRTRSHHRRTSSISISPNSTTRTNARARSPPPSPRRPSIAPPVPPIPDFARVEARQAVLRPRQVADDVVPVITISPPAPDVPLHQSRFSAVPRAAASKGFTCINYLAMHNSRGPMSVSAY